MIDIINLNKSFGSKKVLSGINLKFEKGKVYGIVGENGSGKTTLFNCISGLEKFDGEIKSDHDILKDHIGLLLTNPVFISKVTGWEHLKLFSLAKGLKEENFEERNIFNLPLDQYAETYSTGMKKKLALMGILLQKNDIYILDEPFNGVDLFSNEVILSMINKLKQANKIILISSHILSTLKECCDTIHLLSNSTITFTAQKSEFDNFLSHLKKDIENNILPDFDID